MRSKLLKSTRSCLDAWQTIVILLWSQENDEAAIAWCAPEVLSASPNSKPRSTDCAPFAGPRAEQRLERCRRVQLEQETSARLALVRKALEDHQYAEAVELCREILASSPEHSEAGQRGIRSEATREARPGN